MKRETYYNNNVISGDISLFLYKDFLQYAFDRYIPHTLHYFLIIILCFAVFPVRDEYNLLHILLFAERRLFTD